jgi:hypothetical protein
LRSFLDEKLGQLKKVGLLEEGIKGYFPRFYLWDEIDVDQESFVSAIAPYVGGSGEARRITRSMLGKKDRSFFDPLNFANADAELTSKSGVLKSRKLDDVPTEVLLPFIDTDVSNVMRRYGRMVSAQIEYAKLTPGNPLDGLNLSSVKTRVSEIMDNRISKAPAKRKQGLLDKKNRALADIEYIRQIHLGEFDSDPGMHKVLSSVRGVAAMVFLPWSGVASLQDTLAVTLHNSGTAFWGGSYKFARRQLKKSVEAGDLDRRDLSVMARAAEYAMSDMSRSSLLTDFASATERAGRKRPTNAIGRATDSYLTWNGMRPANVMARQVAIHAGGHDLLSALKRRAAGKSKGSDELLLSKFGVTDDIAERFQQEMASGGFVDDGGFLVPALERWSGENADEWSAAIFQNAKLSYVNPSAPVLPKRVKTEVGSLFFQFMSFPWASKNNYLINGYQRAVSGQAGKLAHASIMMTGFGIAYSMLRAAADGEDLSKITPGDMAVRAVDRTGILGSLQIANDTAYGLTSGVFGFDSFLGRKSQADGLGDIPAIAAPAGMVRDARTAVNIFTGEPVTERQKETFGNRIPFANIPPLAASLRALVGIME